MIFFLIINVGICLHSQGGTRRKPFGRSGQIATLLTISSAALIRVVLVHKLNVRFLEQILSQISKKFYNLLQTFGRLEQKFYSFITFNHFPYQIKYLKILLQSEHTKKFAPKLKFLRTTLTLIVLI